MADAYGKLTGRPGICIVTRGPGATQASVGVHTAFQDSTPLILLVGQVASDQEEREAFQEVDYRRMFGPLAKWVAQIDRVDRIPEYVARAFSTACAGRPGPGRARAAGGHARAPRSTSPDAPPVPRRPAAPRPPPHVERLRDLLAACGAAVRDPRRRRLDAAARRATCASSSRRTTLPAGAAFRRQDALDNDSPSYVGDVGIGINPALAARVRDADLLLVVGPRLGEMTTSGYTLLDVPRPRQTLVHVHPGAEELGRVYQAELPILSGMEQFAAAVRDLRVEPRWREWTRAARARLRGVAAATTDAGRRSTSATCIAHAARAGARRDRHERRRQLHRLGPPLLALRTTTRPSSRRRAARWATACRRRSPRRRSRPERTVVCFAGDGDFLMSGQELATAVQYDLPIVVLVVDNGMYGTIRMHQERHVPGPRGRHRPRQPRLRGVRARVRRARRDRRAHGASSPTALERALAAGGRRCSQLRIDPEAINPRTTLSAIRARR